MKLVKKGSTDRTVDVFIQDSSSTIGAGLTGLVFNSAGLVCYYRRGATGSATALTLATQTVGGAHSDGGFVEVSAANMPGLYRLDLADAIVATGVPSVVVMLKGATNMAPVPVEIQLVDFDPEDGVRLGLTAFPNAAADAPGGLPISDAGGLDLDALNTAAVRLTATRAQVLDDWINAGRLDLILDLIAADVVNLDGAAMRGTEWAALAAVCTEARLSELDAGTPGKAAAEVDLIKTDAAAILVDVDTEVAAIKAKTDALPASPASETLLTTVAGYLDTEIAAIKAKTDNLPASPAATILKKNTAFLNFLFGLYDASGDPVAGVTVTAERSIDGAAFAACANAVVGIASGGYKIDFAATDLNGNAILLKFSGAGAKTQLIAVLTQ